MSSPELQQWRAIWMAGRDQAMPPVDQARADFEMVMAAMPATRDIAFQSVRIGGRPAAWLRPPSAPGDRIVFFLHGGGFAVGSPKTHRELAGELARAADATALSLDYRLAPEHPFPAGLDDCLMAYRWLVDQGYRSIVMAGDSAGGGLVLSTMLALRDAGLPLPRAAALFSPWVDLGMTGHSFHSKVEVDPRVTQAVLTVFAQAYLAGTAANTPFASPINADLTGLPPLFIQVGTDELLLDDSTRLAKHARRYDVDVQLEIWPGLVHDWQAYAPLLPEGREAIARAGGFLLHCLAG